MSNQGASSQNSADAGGYVYTDLGELDEVVGGWRNQSDDTRTDGALLADAYYGVRSPSSDVVTTEYFTALSFAFGALYRHNDEMAQYAAGHTESLAASRHQMAEIENDNATMFSRDGGA